MLKLRAEIRWYKQSNKTDACHCGVVGQDQIDINIREVFLRFNGSIFSHYTSCLTPMVANASDEARDAKNLFDQTS